MDSHKCKTDDIKDKKQQLNIQQNLKLKKEVLVHLVRIEDLLKGFKCEGNITSDNKSIESRSDMGLGKINETVESKKQKSDSERKLDDGQCVTLKQNKGHGTEHNILHIMDNDESKSGVKCIVRNLKSVDKEDVKKHATLFHRNERTLFCEFCNRSFLYERAFLKHMTTIHGLMQEKASTSTARQSLNGRQTVQNDASASASVPPVELDQDVTKSIPTHDKKTKNDINEMYSGGSQKSFSYSSHQKKRVGNKRKSRVQQTVTESSIAQSILKRRRRRRNMARLCLQKKREKQMRDKTIKKLRMYPKKVHKSEKNTLKLVAETTTEEDQKTSSESLTKSQVELSNIKKLTVPLTRIDEVSPVSTSCQSKHKLKGQEWHNVDNDSVKSNESSSKMLVIRKYINPKTMLDHQDHSYGKTKCVVPETTIEDQNKGNNQEITENNDTIIDENSILPSTVNNKDDAINAKHLKTVQSGENDVVSLLAPSNIKNKIAANEPLHDDVDKVDKKNKNDSPKEHNVIGNEHKKNEKISNRLLEDIQKVIIHKGIIDTKVLCGTDQRLRIYRNSVPNLFQNSTTVKTRKPIIKKVLAVCSCCKEVFSLMHQIRKKHTSAENMKLSKDCPFCNQHFISFSCLENHITEWHLCCKRKLCAGNKFPVEIIHPEKPINCSNNEELAFECRCCSKKFTYLRMFNDHILNEHSRPNTEKLAQFSSYIPLRKEIISSDIIESIFGKDTDTIEDCLKQNKVLIKSYKQTNATILCKDRFSDSCTMQEVSRVDVAEVAKRVQFENTITERVESLSDANTCQLMRSVCIKEFGKRYEWTTRAEEYAEESGTTNTLSIVDSTVPKYSNKMTELRNELKRKDQSMHDTNPSKKIKESLSMGDQKSNQRNISTFNKFNDSEGESVTPTSTDSAKLTNGTNGEVYNKALKSGIVCCEQTFLLHNEQFKETGTIKALTSSITAPGVDQIHTAEDSQAITKIDNTEGKIIRQAKWWQCEQCKEKFNLIRDFICHKYYSHADDSVIHICENCNKVLTSVAMVNMHVCTNVTSWICMRCNLKFSNGHFLKKHNMEHHFETIGPYKCDECKKSYLTLSMLDRHMSTSHELEVSTMVHNRKQSFNAIEADTSLRLHTLDKAFLRDCDVLSVVQSGSRREEFICNLCKSMHHTKLGIKLHLIKQHKTSVEICNLCNKLYIAKNVVHHLVQEHMILQDHLRDELGKGSVDFTKILGPKQLLSVCEYAKSANISKRNCYPCAACWKEFLNFRFCATHYFRVHDTVCIICNKEFKCCHIAKEHKLKTHGRVGSYLWMVQKVFSSIMASKKYGESIGDVIKYLMNVQLKQTEISSDKCTNESTPGTEFTDKEGCDALDEEGEAEFQHTDTSDEKRELTLEEDVSNEQFERDFTTAIFDNDSYNNIKDDDNECVLMVTEDVLELYKDDVRSLAAQLCAHCNVYSEDYVTALLMEYVQRMECKE